MEHLTLGYGEEWIHCFQVCHLVECGPPCCDNLNPKSSVLAMLPEQNSREKRFGLKMQIFFCPNILRHSFRRRWQILKLWCKRIAAAEDDGGWRVELQLSNISVDLNDSQKVSATGPKRIFEVASLMPHTHCEKYCHLLSRGFVFL